MEIAMESYTKTEGTLLSRIITPFLLYIQLYQLLI